MEVSTHNPNLAKPDTESRGTGLAFMWRALAGATFLAARQSVIGLGKFIPLMAGALQEGRNAPLQELTACGQPELCPA